MQDNPQPPGAITEICTTLEEQGNPELARRLAYLASAADQEPGESPATLESAQAFQSFYSGVKSDGKVDLACSPEGVISATWSFAGRESRACVWFWNDGRVSCATYEPSHQDRHKTPGRDEEDPGAVIEMLEEFGILQRR